MSQVYIWIRDRRLPTKEGINPPLDGSVITVMPNNFNGLNGDEIVFENDLDRLRIEHILQSNRDVWRVINKPPYLAINTDLLSQRKKHLGQFAVFPGSAMLFHNYKREDASQRLLDALIGGGTTAGFNESSNPIVEGIANEKCNYLVSFNHPLSTGSTPWCAEGTTFIFVDGYDIYQHTFGELVSVNGHSRPRSEYFDFTYLADLRDRYNFEYRNHPAGENSPDLDELELILNATFEENQKSLEAAKNYHATASLGTASNSYEPPVLSKYDRPTHDQNGQLKIEIGFSLLHYEKALLEFDNLKMANHKGDKDASLIHGVYCVVAIASCIEAIANQLVFHATGTHPDRSVPGTPLVKINKYAQQIASQQRITFTKLLPGMRAYDALESIRKLRNTFLHAKENQNDIDSRTLSSELASQVSEVNCRIFLKELRLCVKHVYDQLTNLRTPIVTRENVTWMGDLEVP